MAVATIAHHPEMTWEQVMEIFNKEFGNRCRVYSLKRTPRRDFVVQKSGFVGVSVRLEQTKNETKIVFTGFAPSFMARVATAMSIGILSQFLWNGLTSEIKEFVARAPEFQ